MQYFNAATLVNNEHAASWHAWGMLEKREGNLTTARDLWVKVHFSDTCPKPIAGAPASIDLSVTCDHHVMPEYMQVLI